MAAVARAGRRASMRGTLSRVLVIVLFWAAGFAVPNLRGGQGIAAQLTKEQVLDRWADALGGRGRVESIRTVHLHARIETGGMKGTYDRWVTSRGELRTVLDL